MEHSHIKHFFQTGFQVNDSCLIFWGFVKYTFFLLLVPRYFYTSWSCWSSIEVNRDWLFRIFRELFAPPFIPGLHNCYKATLNLSRKAKVRNAVGDVVSEWSCFWERKQALFGQSQENFTQRRRSIVNLDYLRASQFLPWQKKNL